MLLAHSPLAHPSPRSPFTAHSDSLNACLLECWQCKGRWVCVCREKREGRFLLMHLLCSVTLQAHTFILSLLSVSFFLSPRSPRPCSVCLVSLFFCLSVFLSSSCQTYMLISPQTHNLGHTGSHIHPSRVISPPSPLAVFLLNLLDFLAPPSQLLCSAFTPWFRSLRQESAADWGGCF